MNAGRGRRRRYPLGVTLSDRGGVPSRGSATRVGAGPEVAAAVLAGAASGGDAPAVAVVSPPAESGRRRAGGLVLVLVSAVAFGAMPIMAKVAYRSGTESVALLAARFTVGAAMLAAVRRMRLPGRRWPRGRDLVTLFLLGAVGYFGQSMAYFSALERIPAALVAILLYLYPGLVVLIAAVFLRERPGRAAVVCLALAVCGSALTVGPVRGAAPAAGLLLGVAAAVAYSIYIVVSSRVVPRVGALTSIVVVAAGAAFSYDLLAVLTRPAWPRDTGGWLAVAGVGVVGTVVAMLCFFVGLERIGASDASVLSTLEPVVTVALGVVVLGESLGVVQSVGAVLVLAAVVALARLRATPAKGNPRGPADPAGSGGCFHVKTPT